MTKCKNCPGEIEEVEFAQDDTTVLRYEHIIDAPWAEGGKAHIVNCPAPYNPPVAEPLGED